MDGVNVGEDIFLIETNVGKNGGHLMKQLIEYRDRLSRAKRWEAARRGYTLSAHTARSRYCKSKSDSDGH